MDNRSIETLVPYLRYLDSFLNNPKFKHLAEGQRCYCDKRIFSEPKESELIKLHLETVILNEMKDDGWITIESSKEHQTAQIVKLTDTGHKLAGAIIELLENNPELKKTRTFRESKTDSTEDE